MRNKQHNDGLIYEVCERELLMWPAFELRTRMRRFGCMHFAIFSPRFRQNRYFFSFCLPNINTHTRSHVEVIHFRNMFVCVCVCGNASTSNRACKQYKHTLSGASAKRIKTTTQFSNWEKWNVKDAGDGQGDGGDEEKSTYISRAKYTPNLCAWYLHPPPFAIRLRRIFPLLFLYFRSQFSHGARMLSACVNYHRWHKCSRMPSISLSNIIPTWESGKLLGTRHIQHTAKQPVPTHDQRRPYSAMSEHSKFIRHTFVCVVCSLYGKYVLHNKILHAICIRKVMKEGRRMRCATMSIARARMHRNHRTNLWIGAYMGDGDDGLAWVCGCMRTDVVTIKLNARVSLLCRWCGIVHLAKVCCRSHRCRHFSPRIRLDIFRQFSPSSVPLFSLLSLSPVLSSDLSRRWLAWLYGTFWWAPCDI